MVKTSNYCRLISRNPVQKFSLYKSVFLFFRKRQIGVLLSLVVAISIASLIYYYQKGLIIAYGDAESHLNIAKRVISSITPGLGQLGGNWLPLQHIMMLPFVWNDYLWRTGLAGSFVSMASFILSSIFIFQLIRLITRSNLSSWLGTLIFITNPGVLYMQATPMGELPLIVMLVGSIYYFTKWSAYNSLLSLLISALFAFCGSLIRYDMWFLVCLEVLALTIIGLQKKFDFSKIEARIILFLTPASIGIFLWIVWNELIFKNPFYFFLSPYSAKSQQLSWLNRGELLSYHNILNSLLFYTAAAVKNTGMLTFLIASVSIAAILYKIIIKRCETFVLTASLLLFTPFPFYVITLFFGISIILLPSLVPASFQNNMFNVRYGLMMIPAIAVFTALLFSQSKKIGRFIILFILLLQVNLFSSDKMPITLTDAINGLSSRKPGPVNQYVSRNYDYGLIMFDDFSRSANPVELGVKMEKIIYVGNHPYWEESLENPTKHIRWFIIRQDENDVVWNKLKDNREFLENYRGVYNNGKIVVYKRIDIQKSL